MTTLDVQYYFSSSDEAEEAFYSAFEERDLTIMDALLAEKDVTCIHPSSYPLIGRDKVLECWSHLFDSEFDNVFTVDVLSKSITNDFAIHTVSEKVFEKTDLENCVNHVVATNVYIHEINGWRLRSHHASFFRQGEFTADMINPNSSDSDEPN